ncbi:hypothetical protein NL676_015913 [Syzygium grande]|nr:hypothetical protein NL676_015913 [Syzygium grande]
MLAFSTRPLFTIKSVKLPHFRREGRRRSSFVFFFAFEAEGVFQCAKEITDMASLHQRSGRTAGRLSCGDGVWRNCITWQS